MQNTALSRAEYWLAQPEQCIQVEISSQYTGFPQQPQPGGEAESSPLPVGEGGAPEAIYLGISLPCSLLITIRGMYLWV